MLWFIYALGSGFGHLNRCLSLSQSARKLGITISILTSSSYTPILKSNVLDSGINIQAVDLSIAPQFIATQIQQVILGSNCDCFIVDTFAQGLFQELPEVFQLKVKKVFIHRAVKKHHIKTQNWRDLLNSYYDLVVVPEQRQIEMCLKTEVLYTEPWLIRSKENLPSLEQAKAILRCPSNHKIIVVLASGTPDELQIFEQITNYFLNRINFPKCLIRLISVERPSSCPIDCWVSHWPAIECLRAASVVIGAGGYNTVNECQSVGVPLIVFPLPRKFDDQEARVREVQRLPSFSPITIASSFIEIYEKVIEFLQINCFITKTKIIYENGSDVAAKIIANL